MVKKKRNGEAKKGEDVVKKEEGVVKKRKKRDGAVKKRVFIRMVGVSVVFFSFFVDQSLSMLFATICILHEPKERGVGSKEKRRVGRNGFFPHVDSDSVSREDRHYWPISVLTSIPLA